MNLPIPNGYKLYGGADISAVVDAEGSIFYSCDARFPDGSTFGQIIVRVRKNSTTAEVLTLPESVSGRGQLDWSPAGLFLTTWDDGKPKFFQITQFVQFQANYPVVVTTVNGAISAVDQDARNLANSALNVANTAKSVANNAASVANSKPSEARVAEIAWSKASDKLQTVINALNGDRNDGQSAFFIDLLFGKMKDWVFGWLGEWGIRK